MERIADENVPDNISSRVLSGDLWNLGSHRLFCGDATVSDDVSRLLAGAGPHLMVTDPPYGVNYEPSWRKKIGNQNANRMGPVLNDNRPDWSNAWKLFPGDVGYVWFADRHAAVVQTSLENQGLFVRNQIVWVKTRPVISRGHYGPQAEFCYYAVRKGETAHWEGLKSQSTVWKIRQSRRFAAMAIARRSQSNACSARSSTTPKRVTRSTIHLSEAERPSSPRRKAVADATRWRIDPGYCAVAIERFQRWTNRTAVLETSGKSYLEVMQQRNREARVDDVAGQPEVAS